MFVWARFLSLIFPIEDKTWTIVGSEIVTIDLFKSCAVVRVFFCTSCIYLLQSCLVHLSSVHTLPVMPWSRTVKLNSFKASEALKFIIILQNLITTYHRKSGESKYDRTRCSDHVNAAFERGLRFIINKIIKVNV